MAGAHKTTLRALQKITSHFRISASCHLWLILIRKILEIACYSSFRKKSPSRAYPERALNGHQRPELQLISRQTLPWSLRWLCLVFD